MLLEQRDVNQTKERKEDSKSSKGCGNKGIQFLWQQRKMRTRTCLPPIYSNDTLVLLPSMRANWPMGGYVLRANKKVRHVNRSKKEIA
jgi:hypothetical protein